MLFRSRRARLTCGLDSSDGRDEILSRQIGDVLAHEFVQAAIEAAEDDLARDDASTPKVALVRPLLCEQRAQGRAIAALGLLALGGGTRAATIFAWRGTEQYGEIWRLIKANRALVPYFAWRGGYGGARRRALP